MFRTWRIFNNILQVNDLENMHEKAFFLMVYIFEIFWINLEFSRKNVL